MFSKKTIDVEFLRSMPVHETFGRAVSASESRDAAANRDNGELSGDTIDRCTFTGRVLVVSTSKGKTLTIFVGEAGVDWDVVAADTKSVEFREPPPVLTIRFPSGREHEWRWREILDSMLGKPIRALAPSETTVSFYVRGCPDLLFSALVARDEGDLEKILFFGEE